MIPSDQLDHVVTIWRATERRGEALRETVREWAPVPGMDRIRLGVQVMVERRENVGEGSAEIPGGQWWGLGSAYVDAEQGDVVEILEGPEAPKLTKVESAMRPMMRHTELVLSPFVGRLA